MADLPGVAEVPCLDSTSIMELTEVPEHLFIVGSSYIVLEFAQMMRRFGSRVTVIQRLPALLPREDEDVCAGIRQILG